MINRTRIFNARLLAVMCVLGVGLSVQASADEAANDTRQRAKLARLEAQQAMDLHSKFQKMATEARELVYTLPVARRSDASKRADVLQKSAERASTTHAKLSAWADELDRQLAQLDIAAADRLAASDSLAMPVAQHTQPTSTYEENSVGSAISRAPTHESLAMVQPVSAPGLTDVRVQAQEARVAAEQARSHSGGLRLAVNEAKAELMQLSGSDSVAQEKAREKVRALNQEAKIAAWQFRDLDAKARELEAQTQ